MEAGSAGGGILGYERSEVCYSRGSVWKCYVDQDALVVGGGCAGY